MPRRPIHALFRVTLGLASILGVLSLLLADSTECDSTSVDLTFDVTTTCNGGQSGRIHLASDASSTQAIVTPQLLSGTLQLDEATLVGTCPGGSKPTFDHLILRLTPQGPQAPPIECDVDLGAQLGQAVACSAGIDGGIDPSCTLTLTEVP